MGRAGINSLWSQKLFVQQFPFFLITVLVTLWTLGCYEILYCFLLESLPTFWKYFFASLTIPSWLCVCILSMLLHCLHLHSFQQENCSHFCPHEYCIYLSAFEIFFLLLVLGDFIMMCLGIDFFLFPVFSIYWYSCYCGFIIFIFANYQALFLQIFLSSLEIVLGFTVF